MFMQCLTQKPSTKFAPDTAHRYRLRASCRTDRHCFISLLTHPLREGDPPEPKGCACQAIRRATRLAFTPDTNKPRSLHMLRRCLTVMRFNSLAEYRRAGRDPGFGSRARGSFTKRPAAWRRLGAWKYASFMSYCWTRPSIVAW